MHEYSEIYPDIILMCVNIWNLSTNEQKTAFSPSWRKGTSESPKKLLL